MLTDILLAIEPVVTVVGTLVIWSMKMQKLEDKTDSILKQVEKQNGNVAKLTEKNQENEVEIAVLSERLENYGKRIEGK